VKSIELTAQTHTLAELKPVAVTGALQTSIAEVAVGWQMSPSGPSRLISLSFNSSAIIWKADIARAIDHRRF
jgi:hypothetical protein